MEFWIFFKSICSFRVFLSSCGKCVAWSESPQGLNARVGIWPERLQALHQATGSLPGGDFKSTMYGPWARAEGIFWQNSGPMAGQNPLKDLLPADTGWQYVWPPWLWSCVSMLSSCSSFGNGNVFCGLKYCGSTQLVFDFTAEVCLGSQKSLWRCEQCWAC